MSNTKPTFEENMRRLEQIVRTMERGDAPLEESMKLVQEGTDLVAQCSSMLDHAEQQVTKIVVQPDGQFTEEMLPDGEDR